MPRKKDKNFGDHRDYDVGYRRPPVHSRFQPGHSGNPKGRPKQTKANRVNSIIEEELFRTIRIKQDGFEQKLPAFQAIVRGIVIAGAKGNTRALAIGIEMASGLEQRQNQSVAEPTKLTHEERAKRIMEILTVAKARRDKNNSRNVKKDRASSK